MGHRRILVSSNCQTGGLTATLRLLLPDDDVQPFPWPAATGEAYTTLVEQIRVSDVWMTTAANELVERVKGDVGATACEIVTGPEIFFDGYHPDMAYASGTNGVGLVGPAGPYNSAIALWGFTRGLDVDAIVRLFVPEVFERLGYTRRWQAVASVMGAAFAERGFDVQELLLPLKHRGPFMHTIDHPRISAIAQLGRMFGRRLGAGDAAIAEPIEHLLVDALMAASFVCPVYPGIAEALGLRGSFTWKRADHSVVRLREFVAESLAVYEGHAPEWIYCAPLRSPEFCAVLETAAFGGTS